MYAKVIVDVPAKQTDRTYDYAVPPALQSLIEVGSRVGVRFGARRIQGFVVALHDESTIDHHKIREIEQLLDAHPPLNEELVALSEWMSRTYVCHRITSLQAMIPGALKAKYDRKITLANDEPLPPDSIEAQIVSHVATKRQTTLSALLSDFPDEAMKIRSLIADGVLSEVQTIHNRVGKKKELMIIPPEDPQVLTAIVAQVPKRAHRQHQVLHYLIAHPQPISLTALSTQLEVAASTIKSMADKGWFELKAEEVYRDPYAHRQFSKTEPLTFTAEQATVFEQLCRPLHEQVHAAFLLHGVTGSGKTEVYLQAIEQCLQQGREAIVLVPEISLTPQMVERFKGRFGEHVAVLHSRLSLGERYDEWRKIQHKRVQVVIGARSAIFAPFTKLGLIIIDEEHEASYKQEESPKYHARDIALHRAQHHQAVVVLGSATPSLESYYQAKFPQNKLTASFKLLEMAERVENRPMPAVQIIDMRNELRGGNRSMFSRALHTAIVERLERQEQIVLMLNRRGFSTFIMCRSCGYVCECPHCDIALTYHRKTRNVRCHYCGYAEKEVASCPQCESEHIRFFGTGTQRVEEQLRQLFPDVGIIRMDVDTTAAKHAHEKLLQSFGNGEASILLGTQMVAKGLDFPRVTLVGVIAADTILNLPDFRAGEKTFQLLTQVAGRAGRHQLPGEVVVQTYNPEHYSIIHAGGHDYISFAQYELQLRKARDYPPFCQLILITLSHEEVAVLVRMSELLAKHLRQQAQALTAEVKMDILGPVAASIPRIKDRYRFQCIVKYEEARVIALITEAIAHFETLINKENLQINVDVNPQVLM